MGAARIVHPFERRRGRRQHRERDGQVAGGRGDQPHGSRHRAGVRGLLERPTRALGGLHRRCHPRRRDRPGDHRPAGPGRYSPDRTGGSGLTPRR